jgi:hypothetical protein
MPKTTGNKTKITHMCVPYSVLLASYTRKHRVIPKYRNPNGRDSII